MSVPDSQTDLDAASVESGERPAFARLPVVAIVGRPNVGKSSIFNRLARSRIAIEDPTPGTTRDRVSFELLIQARNATSDYRGQDRWAELVDAAGIGAVDDSSMEHHVAAQIQFAIAAADILLFITDAKEGVLPLDTQVAKQLRGIKKPLFVIANKADAPHHDALAQEFHSLGLGDVLAVSAKEGRGIKDLHTLLLENLPPAQPNELSEPPTMKLAIIGKRNSGKSSLVNFFASDERLIVSELPGTTRDSVDVRFSYKGMEFIAIDTAGIQRKRGIRSSVEFFSQARSVKAIRRADVIILLMDCLEQTSRLDRKLAEEALRHSKPVVVGVNKWDLAGDTTTYKFQQYITAKLPAVHFAPIVFMSVKDKSNCTELIEIAMEVHRQNHYRVGTGELNRAVQEAFSRHKPRPRYGRAAKLYYATQIEVTPPTLIIYVNDTRLFRDDYIDYLKNRLRDHFPFSEIPIKLIFKNRERMSLEELQNS